MAVNQNLYRNGIMELRVCPECEKAFYSPPDGDFLSCPHCGFVLFDRRGGQRVRREAESVLSIRGRKLRATLKDYSTGGARVEYSGPDLERDTVIELYVDDLDIHARAVAVWTKKASGDVKYAGFRLL